MDWNPLTIMVAIVGILQTANIVQAKTINQKLDKFVSKEQYESVRAQHEAPLLLPVI